ncbi:MAG: S9 family peptidase [Phycisphaerae bacterium]|nr:S9 family peptidase [Phycisphaerae bacterium]
MRIALLIVSVFLASAFTPARAGDTHPFSVHDMVAMQRISDHQVSPDGRHVAFVLRTTDLEANRGRPDIWLVDVDGTNLRQLTTDPESDWNPRWSPDGADIYFLSTRSGSAQVHRIPLAGGEARQITSLPLDVGMVAASPNGNQLAISLDVYPGLSVKETVARRDEITSRKATGRVYDQLFIRHWDEWKDGRRSHVFVIPTDGSGEPMDIMKDMNADCPTKPFGGPEDMTFTPDGKSVVFSARDVGRTEAWSTDFDLYVAPIDGSAAPRCLTTDNEAVDTQPVFSPDGKTLAYLAMTRPGYEADRLRIVLMSWPDGAKRTLTEDWDHSPRSIAWSSDSKDIYATADHLGQHALFAIDAKTGAARTIVGEGSVYGVASAGDRIVYGLHHLRSPVELYTVRGDGSGVKKITDINAERLAAARMGEPEQFTFKGWNDETVYAYIVKPVDFDPGRKYPVAFLIHGGPQGSFGNDFHYRWNPQAYAGAGYAAVMVDFHGSTGYGQAFCDSIRGDWGGKPLVDLQKGLDAALKKYNWMDADRVSALGASYGGYMINWIAGNWPDRFRCLVSHDGNLDERFAYYDTEELWFPEWDHMGTPWDNPEGYKKHNPINFVKNWQTPMLVIHGARDFRVVETQGTATFTALQRRGIPSKFLYFPDENHWVLKPANSILWHETVLGWLDEWTKK